MIYRYKDIYIYINSSNVNTINSRVYITIVFHNQTTHSPSYETTTSSQPLPSTMLSSNKTKDISNGLHMNHPINYYQNNNNIEVDSEDDLVRSNHKEQQQSNKDYEYRIALYINGQLDIDMQFSTIVIGNTYPLHLFNDISHKGNDLISTYMILLVIYNALLVFINIFATMFRLCIIIIYIYVYYYNIQIVYYCLYIY